MRKPEEKKQKVTSVRLTEDQHQRLKDQADARGMSVSNYLITTAVHGENNITPEIMVRMQNLVNEVSDIAQEYAPEKKQQIQKEVNQLWCLLK